MTYPKRRARVDVARVTRFAVRVMWGKVVPAGKDTV